MSKTASQSQENPELWRKKIMRTAILHALEVVALILALFLALCGGLAWRLAQGPVSLEFLRDDAEAALTKLFEGGEAHIASLQAIWSAQDRTIVIAARGVRIVDANGQVLVEAPQLDVGVSAGKLLQRRLAIQRVVAIGGEFSFVRRRDGAVGGGLGAPKNIVPGLSAPYPQAGVGKGSEKNALPELLGRLRVLEMRDTTLHFVDERAGVNWTAPHANIRFVRAEDRIAIHADGKIESSAGATSLSIDASSHPDFSRMNAQLSLGNAVPAALSPASVGPWQWLGGIDAPLDAQISFTTDEGGLLRSADGHIRLAQGVFRKGQSELPIESAELVFGFDPVDGAVNIELAELRSAALTGSLTGRVSGLDPARLAIGEQIKFDLVFENISANPGGVLADTMTIHRLGLDGVYKLAQGEAQIEHFDISFFDLNFNGSAVVTLPDEALDRDAPLFTLSARSRGEIAPGGILALWPSALAFGARDWVKKNVLSARMHDFVLDIRLPQRIIGASHLDNDMLTLSFAFDEASSHFVHVMTPLGEAKGTGVLRGNRFDLQLSHARLFDLELTEGFVEIPRLSPKGVTGRFGAHAKGPLVDVMTVLDQDPFGFISKYGLSPAAITGQGDIDFTITRPMRVQVPARQVGFSVTGEYDTVRVAGLMAGQDLAQAKVILAADTSGLQLSGEGKIGPIAGDFIWQERFFPENEPRTRLFIDAITDAHVFDELGVPTRLFLDGPVGLHLETIGEGLNINSATLKVDLTTARLMSPAGDWEKPAGQEGSAGLVVALRDDGGYEITDFEASTDGFFLAGDLSIAAKGGVQSARIKQARMAGLFDFSADLQRGEDGIFVLNGQAQSMDARGFVRGLTQGASTNFGIALSAHIEFERALISDDVTFKDGVIDFKRSQQQIEYLDFSADTPNGKASFLIAPGEAGLRQLSGRTDDAGLVIAALFGMDSIRDGVLLIDGVLGDGGEQNPGFDITMSDFKLGNVPAMARILSLGSLTGIADTMSGEGLSFRKLIAPLEFEDGKMKIGAARATGPALGITVTGMVDLVGKTMKMNGTLAPAYTINSALGKIPLLGSVFVSRKGEGVFGLSYRVDGPYDALQVFVNPLSVLTPGFLRRIFEGGNNDGWPEPQLEQAPVSEENSELPAQLIDESERYAEPVLVEKPKARKNPEPPAPMETESETEPDTQSDGGQN